MQLSQVVGTSMMMMTAAAAAAAVEEKAAAVEEKAAEGMSAALPHWRGSWGQVLRKAWLLQAVLPWIPVHSLDACPALLLLGRLGSLAC